MKRHNKNPLQWKPVALAVALAFAPAYARAQQITPAAGGPSVGASLNGTPSVNIVAPNGAGLSHNKYIDFGTTSTGAILNNSSQAVVTQIGGAVAGNPNLAGGSARIILNEVISTNRSVLNGPLEVAGTAADVVVANPNGITCGGCGFINTPRATLTTGTPNIDGAGNLTGFSVRQGDILITPDGANATGATFFDILARSVVVNGQINGKDVLIAGGVHDFDYANRDVRSVGGSGSGFGIDSSVLGGMYVDRIRLVTTEAGVGVRLLANVAANVDDLVLTAAGQVVLRGQFSGRRDVAMSGKGIDVADGVQPDGATVNPASVYAARNLSLDAGTGAMLLAGGTLGAAGNSNFSAASLTDTGGAGSIRFADGALTLGITGVAAISNTTWNGAGSFDLTAGSLTVTNAGQLTSATSGTPSGAVTLTTTGGTLKLNDAQVGGASVTMISAGTLALDTAKVDGRDSVDLTGVNVTLNSGGQVESGGTASVTASGTFTNSGSVSAASTLTLSGNAVTNNSDLFGDYVVTDLATLNNAGRLQGATGGDVTATTLANTGTILGAVTDPTTVLTVTSDALTNSGTIQSNGDLFLVQRGTLSNTGTLLSAGLLSLRLPSNTDSLTFNNGVAGKVEAGGLLEVRDRSSGGRGITINNPAGGTFLGGDLSISANTINNTGSIKSTTGGEVDVIDFSNLTPGSRLAFGGTGFGGGLNFTGTLENQGAIFSAGDLTVDGGASGVLNNRGTAALFAGGNMWVRTGGSLYNLGAILATQDISFQVRSMTNDLTLDSTDGHITGLGTILAQGNMSVQGYNTTVANDFTNRGFVDVVGNAEVNAQTFVNETVAPAIVPDGLWHVTSDPRTVAARDINQILALLPSGWINGLGNNNNFGPNDPGVVKDSEVPMRLLSSGVQYSAACAALPPGGCPDFYALVYNDQFPGNPQLTGQGTPPVDFFTGNQYFYIYRNVQGTIYTGAKFVSDPSLNQAHFKASNITLNIQDATNTGAILSAAGTLTVNELASGGTFTNQPLQLTDPRLIESIGVTREKRFCPNPDFCFNSSMTPTLNDDWRLIDSADGGLATAITPPVLLGSIGVLGSTAQASTVTMNVSVTNGTRPAQVTNPQGGTGHASSPTAGVPNATPTGASTAPGLNLQLPTNPNGLFVVNRDPNAKYLIETNPLFTSLESPAFGSDYLIQRLGLNPDTVMQRLGDPRYENQLVAQEVAAQSGRTLIATAANQDDMMKKLMDNAAWESKELNLSFGVALSPIQANALKQDIVWMVETVVAGHKVLAPVVYLASANRATAQDSKIIANNLSVADATSFVNTGTVDVQNNLSIRTTGDIVNAAGTIKGGNVDLTSERGNITNTTTVQRFGDDDNHTDTTSRIAGITATGNLNMNAQQGSITSTGSDLSAGGNAALSAGRDVTLTNIVTEKKTTVEYSSGNWLTGESTTRIVTVDQQSQGSNLSAGGNLSVTAGNAVNLTGSQATAGRDVNVQARDVNVTNATTTDSRYEYTSKSGWGTSGGTAGYRSSSTTTNTTNTNVIASGITGRNNVNITGTNSVTVQGSDVSSGNNLNVNTQNLTTRAAEQKSETTTSTSGWGVAIGGKVDSNQMSWALSGGTSDSNGNASASIARSSTLSSGGNMNLNSQGGTISHQGTQIMSQGDFTQQAQTINMTAAQNSFNSASSSSSIGGAAGGGLYYNAGTFADLAKGGSVPSVGMPSVQSSATMYNNNSSSVQSSTQAVTANITARGNVTSRSTGTTTMEGSQIQAGNVATIDAGKLDFRAAKDTASSTNNSSTLTAGAQAGIDATGKPTGGAEGAYSDSNASGSSSTAVTGSIVSNGGTRIRTTGDATFEGTNLRSGGSTSIAAGGSVNFNAAQNTSSSSSSSQAYAGAVGQDTSGTGGNKQGSGSFSNSSGSGNSATAVVGSIASTDGIAISAGKAGDVVMQGTNLASDRGNVSVSAGRDVKLEAAVSTSSSDSTGFGGSFSGSAGGKDKKSDDGKGGHSVDISGSYSNQSGNQTIETGGSISGRNITIASGRDMSMQGTQVEARSGVNLNVGGALTMQSAQSTSSSSGLAAGGEVGGTSSTTKTGSDGKDSSQAGGGNIGFNFGQSGANSTVNQNARVSGGSVTINTGGDMTMQGANVSGGQVTTNVGGNLNIESRVDTSSSSSTNVSGYAGGSGFNRDAGGKRGQYGGDLRTGASGSLGIANSDSSRVAERSGIQGADSTTVNVLTGSTTLKGGVIASGQGGTTTLNTRSLTQSGIDVSSSSSNLQGGGGLSMNTQQVPGGSRNSDSSSSTVNSQVGAPGQQVQATLNIAAVSRVLSDPAVQTALILNKGVKAEIAKYDSVPPTAYRKLLTDAGIAVPADASVDTMKVMLNTALESGYAAATTRLSTSGIAQGQIDGILRAIIP
jgi:filamentous hemagglutinin